MTASLFHFTPCGLIFDASGVVLLGFAFFLKTTESMIEESGTTWGSKAYVAVAESKSDGVFGTMLLFLGFVYQMLGYVGLESTAAVVASYFGLILFLLAYCTFLRKMIVAKLVGNIEAKFRERESS